MDIYSGFMSFFDNFGVLLCCFRLTVFYFYFAMVLNFGIFFYNNFEYYVL
nr:hypothetical protein [Morganella morganii]